MGFYDRPMRPLQSVARARTRGRTPRAHHLFAELPRVDDPQAIPLQDVHQAVVP